MYIEFIEDLDHMIYTLRSVSSQIRSGQCDHHTPLQASDEQHTDLHKSNIFYNSVLRFTEQDIHN